VLPDWEKYDSYSWKRKNTWRVDSKILHFFTRTRMDSIKNMRRKERKVRNFKMIKGKFASAEQGPA